MSPSVSLYFIKKASTEPLKTACEWLLFPPEGLEQNEQEALRCLLKGHPQQDQAVCNPAEVSEAGLKAVTEIPVNQWGISADLSNKLPRQACASLSGTAF